MYTYLKFGLPRVFPPNEANPQNYANNNNNHNGGRSRLREASMNGACSSGYDSSDNETTRNVHPHRYSVSDFRTLMPNSSKANSRISVQARNQRSRECFFLNKFESGKFDDDTSGRVVY